MDIQVIRARFPRRCSQYTRSHLGAALVEFAMVLPVIMLFMAGILESCRLLMLQHSVDTAAYEGARCAMVPGAQASDAQTAAQTLLGAAGLRNASITVEPDFIEESTSLITVTVELPISGNTWLPPVWITAGTVQSSVSLVTERPPLVQLTGVPKLKMKLSTKTKATGL